MTHLPQADHKTWGSQFWLRNGAHTSTNRAHKTPAPTHLPPHTLFPECGSEATAPPRTTTQIQRSLAKHPVTQRAAVFTVATTACAAGCLTHPPNISNRS